MTSCLRGGYRSGRFFGATVSSPSAILKLSATNTDKYVAYNGTGTIQGVLLHGVDMAARSTAANEPAPMIYHTAVFATAAIVGFTNYASALVSSLSTCKFE